MSRSLLRKTPCGPILFSVNLPQASAKFSYGRLITRGLTVIICFYPKIFFDHFSLQGLTLVSKMSEHALLVICPYDLNIVLDAWLIVTAWKLFSGSTSSYRLDFRRLPGPVFDPPRREGMSAGSFSRTAAGNRAYSGYICFNLFTFSLFFRSLMWTWSLPSCWRRMLFLWWRKGGL